LGSGNGFIIEENIIKGNYTFRVWNVTGWVIQYNTFLASVPLYEVNTIIIKQNYMEGFG
jgi:hypothetical protein